MSQIKSQLTPLGIERVLQSPDGRTLTPATIRFTQGWQGVTLLDEAGKELGSLWMEQPATLLAGDHLSIDGLLIEVSLKVSFT